MRLITNVATSLINKLCAAIILNLSSRTSLKPATEVAEKEEEITEKEFKENWRYKCVTRWRYVRYNGRLYKKVWRICYRRLQSDNLDMSDTEFFKGKNV